MKEQNKNRGVDLFREKLERDPEKDWVFGALSPDCIYAVPIEKREEYLPEGEHQAIGKEKMDCVSRGYINILETKFTYALRNGLIKSENATWLKANGYVVIRGGKESVEFSDVFVAILSGTTRDGNSMKAPAETIRKSGLVPKSKLTQLEGWDENYNSQRITKELTTLGQEFLKRWAINYEQVQLDDLAILLKRDCANLAGYAWPKPKKGEYPKTKGPFNHAFMAFAVPLTCIFDNYLDDGKKGDWIKKLASDYAFFEYGYRPFVREEMIPTEYESLLKRIIRLAKEILEGMMPPKSYDQDPKTLPMNQEDESKEEKPVEKPAISLQQELLELSTKLLGTNVRSGTAPKEKGCGDAFTSVIAQVMPFKNEVSTTRLNKILSTDSRFKRTLDLTPGNIIISPTDGDSIGHCGVILENNKIASNNSFSGLWDDFYTIESWVDRYRKKLGLPVYVYQIKE